MMTRELLYFSAIVVPLLLADSGGSSNSASYLLCYQYLLVMMCLLLVLAWFHERGILQFADQFNQTDYIFKDSARKLWCPTCSENTGALSHYFHHFLNEY